MTRLVRRASLLLLILVAGSCRDLTSLGPPAFFTATIDGAPWQANYYVDYAVAGYDSTTQRLEIIGLEVAFDYSGREVSVIIEPFTGVGTYALGAPDQATAYGSYITSPDLRLSGADRDSLDRVYTTMAPADGTVEITEWNQAEKRIAGTFTFTAYDTTDASQFVGVGSGSVSGNVVPLQTGQTVP